MTASASRFSILSRTACALTLAIAPGFARAETVNLRPKFEKGTEASYTLAIDAQNEATRTGSAEPQKQHINQEIGLRLKVNDVDAEKGAKVDLTYDSFKLKVDGGPMPIEFDSATPAEKDEGNPVAGAFRPLVGTTLHLIIDKDGNVTDVTGGEELAQGIAGQALSGYVTSGGVRGLLGPIFSTRQTKGEASVGETWTYEDVMPNSVIGQMKIVSNHTLKSVDGGNANIDLAGNIDFKPAEGGPTITLKEGTYNGNYVWDTKAGMLKSMNAKLVAALEGDLGGASASKNIATTTLTRTK